MRRRLMGSAGQIAIADGDGAVGDILMVENASEEKFLIKQNSLSKAIYPASKFTPIGVVVIPKSHDVYGTGEIGIVGLLYCDSDSSTNRGVLDYKAVTWGSTYRAVSGLKNFTKVPNYGVAGSQQLDLISEENSGCLPTTYNSAVKCLHDDKAYYYSETVNAAPSPYLSNGEKNDMYSSTDVPSSSLNMLSDFNGLSNTQAINEMSSLDYPAARYAKNHIRPGTSKGDWYLPACGELGYLAARFQEIKDSFDKIKKIYNGEFFAATLSTSGLWSSTQNNASNAAAILMSKGTVAAYGKAVFTYGVLPFLRFKVEDEEGF